MRGLRKYISPFTPDQSGAESVLFGYGGMLIIMDAGGCVGNVCGYDEPRWGSHKSGIFSAGLRDLDAILGRDELLIRKIKMALSDMEASFIGLIGTPVPATIATDYRALKRLLEKDTGIPVLPVETNGIELYDAGQEKAYKWLFREFMDEEYNEKDNRIGVLGATPLDVTDITAGEEIRHILEEKYGAETVVYGMGDSLDDVRKAKGVQRNLVVSPSGLKTARMLQRDYGIPYETGYPVKESHREGFLTRISPNLGKRILIIHQQVFANEIRNWVEVENPEVAVTVASWFRMDGELRRDRDVHLEEERDLLETVRSQQIDTVMGDPLLRRALPGWQGTFLDLPHFPVSGELHSSDSTEEYWRKAGALRC